MKTLTQHNDTSIRQIVNFICHYLTRLNKLYIYIYSGISMNSEQINTNTYWTWIYWYYVKEKHTTSLNVLNIEISKSITISNNFKLEKIIDIQWIF